MSAPPETFEATLIKWQNARILPLGAQEIAPDQRDYVINERTVELAELCRERGNYAELVAAATSFGGIEDFVRHLIQATDARGTSSRPTAHDGADD